MLNQGVHTGRNEEEPLGDKFNKHRQVIATFVPDHLVGSILRHVVGAQPRMCRVHVGDKHSPHLHFALTQDLASTLHGYRPHQDCGETREFLGETVAEPLLGRGKR